MLAALRILARVFRYLVADGEVWVGNFFRGGAAGASSCLLAVEEDADFTAGGWAISGCGVLEASTQ